MARIKICGLTRVEDAALAIELGAWALGFIFYPPSPRYISPLAVSELLAELRRRGKKLPKTVGVFVDEGPESVREQLRISGVESAQLHGSEPPATLVALQDIELIKAFRLRDEQELAGLPVYESLAAAWLFDAAVPGAYGGTGQKADWSLIEKVPKRKPLILSGGLGPENVREALSRLAPFALDLSSGVESRPGIKDPQKLQRLFQEAGASHAVTT